MAGEGRENPGMDLGRSEILEILRGEPENPEEGIPEIEKPEDTLTQRSMSTARYPKELPTT